jgi:hypothetical protein
MKLPNIYKILMEDIKDPPPWIGSLIDPINSFMEAVYQSLNSNITFTENIASNVKELTLRTSSAYPVMENIEFMTGLKTRAIGCLVLQAYEKGTYAPAPGPYGVAWVENNGNIVISKVTGLEASKVYILRFLVI